MHEPPSHQSPAKTNTHAYALLTFSPINCDNTHACICMSYCLTNQLPEHTHTCICMSHLATNQLPEHTHLHMHEPLSHQSTATTHTCICMSYFLTNLLPEHMHMHMHELAFHQSVSINSIQVNSTTPLSCLQAGCPSCNSVKALTAKLPTVESRR